MMTYYIEKFLPLRYGKYDLDQIGLNKLLEKQMEYASCGKAALYHCLLSLGLKRGDKVLVPNYICSSILVPIDKLGLKPVYYDINERDLNASIDSIKWNKENDSSIKAVLVASMYGNPADLETIERYCRERQLFLIDDAAQSFGAKTNGRYVGTFGDAGFFSFSPGKATSGHLGAFFWTSNNNYHIHKRNHFLYHRVAYWNYYFNRYEIYRYQNNKLRFILRYIDAIARKFTNYWNDKLNDFEKQILGGILHENFSQTFRQEFAARLYRIYQDNEYFRVITKGTVGSNNHKLVLICKSKEIADSLMNHFRKCRIFTLNGYPLLNNNANTPIAHDIDRRVVEIPLENDKKKFEYIVRCIREFKGHN